MPLVPKHIRNLQSYRPGRPIEDVRRELGLKHIIKLASNENPHGPSPMALEAVQSTLADNFLYPDASAFILRGKLAGCFNLKIDNVVVGGGSEGVMSTIMRTFLLSDDEIVSAANSFIGFRVLANASGRKVHWVPMKNYRYDLETMAEKVTDYTKIIYIANPDNPMGTYITRKEFEEFYVHIPERVLIILDEAYYEFAQSRDDYPDSMTYRYDNIITLRTFSKAYGLAGLRIGYGFAHDELIRNLIKVKEPFSPSLIAHTAGSAAMDDSAFLEKTLTINDIGYTFLQKELTSLGIETVPSVANFITSIWETNMQALDITQSLLNEGVIVRNLKAFGWPNCIRISIGTADENGRFIDALKSILSY